MTPAFLRIVRGLCNAGWVRVSLQKCILFAAIKNHPLRYGVTLHSRQVWVSGNVRPGSLQYAVKVEREPGIRALKAELKVIVALQCSSWVHGQ